MFRKFKLLGLKLKPARLIRKVESRPLTVSWFAAAYNENYEARLLQLKEAFFLGEKNV